MVSIESARVRSVTSVSSKDPFFRCYDQNIRLPCQDDKRDQARAGPGRPSAIQDRSGAPEAESNPDRSPAECAESPHRPTLSASSPSNKRVIALYEQLAALDSSIEEISLLEQIELRKKELQKKKEALRNLKLDAELVSADSATETQRAQAKVQQPRPTNLPKRKDDARSAEPSFSHITKHLRYAPQEHRQISALLNFFKSRTSASRVTPVANGASILRTRRILAPVPPPSVSTLTASDIGIWNPEKGKPKDGRSEHVPIEFFIEKLKYLALVHGERQVLRNMPRVLQNCENTDTFCRDANLTLDAWCTLLRNTYRSQFSCAWDAAKSYTFAHAKNSHEFWECKTSLLDIAKVHDLMIYRRIRIALPGPWLCTIPTNGSIIGLLYAIRQKEEDVGWPDSASNQVVGKISTL